MALVISGAEVEAIASGTMAAMVDAVELGLREEAAGRVVMPPRQNLSSAQGFFRMMAALMNDSGLMGFKVFHGTMKTGVRYLIALYEQKETQRLLALLDGEYLTAARTGATTGVATRWMTDPGADQVGIIGSGLEARTNLMAVAAVRPIRGGKVFSPNPERRQAFARWVGAQMGIEMAVVSTPEAAVRDVPIVIVATNTSRGPQPVAYRGAWMAPGVHVNSIGSTMRTLREIDADTFGNAGRVVVDNLIGAEDESGDVIEAKRLGKFEGVLELKELVSGRAQGRQHPDQITLFKSVGTALQDVMGGFAIYQEAVRHGLGREIGDFPGLKTF